LKEVPQEEAYENGIAKKIKADVEAWDTDWTMEIRASHSLRSWRTLDSSTN
jgi:hypothetical protein